MTVRPYRATTLRELEAALEALLRDGMEGLVNFQGGLSLANRQHIVDFAATHRRPAIYQSEFFIEAGGLMAWAPDQEEQYREAARYVDRILRGARPGDLPVRYPTHYALTLNAGAASRLALALPPALRRAGGAPGAVTATAARIRAANALSRSLTNGCS